MFFQRIQRAQKYTRLVEDAVKGIKNAPHRTNQGIDPQAVMFLMFTLTLLATNNTEVREFFANCWSNIIDAFRRSICPRRHQQNPPQPAEDRVVLAQRVAPQQPDVYVPQPALNFLQRGVRESLWRDILAQVQQPDQKNPETALVPYDEQPNIPLQILRKRYSSGPG